MTPARLSTLTYFLTVFITGAAVLIFEVSAVRLLAPYFGSSLYVLSSVLSTVLLALSLGYFFGGRLADKMPHYLPLYIIIGSAGIIMLILQLVSLYLLPYSNEVFSIVSGPLFLSLLLFFLPAFLLGIDSPYVIKLLTQNQSVEHAGAVVGSTFFWSTIGSIVGSISAGFYFIPYLGLTATITYVSLTLIFWSCVAGYIQSRTLPVDAPYIKIPIPRTILVIIALVVGIILANATLNFKPPQSTDTTLYREDGFYSNIHIFDRTIGTTTYRFLKNDVNNSSAIIPGSQDIVFEYAQLADIFTSNIPEAKNYLVLGGGSYTIPRAIHYRFPNLPISVVETEGRLYPLAMKYFELPDTPLIRNYEMDARVFLQGTSTQFDVIFSDVMNSGHFFPPHLATQEFFTSLRNRLSPQGIGIINFIGSLPNEDISLTGSMIKTISSVFLNYKLIAIFGPGYTGVQNLLFIVRHDGQPITIPDTDIKNMFAGEITSATKLVVYNNYNLKNQVLFTDDKSLVEPLVFTQFAIPRH